MAYGVRLNFGAQRNEDYKRLWRMKDSDGNYIDLTRFSASLRINTSAGLAGTPLLALGQSPVGHGSLITINTEPSGLLILIKKEDIAALPGRQSDIIPFAYNLLLTDSVGIRRAEARGTFTVEPGV